MVVSLKQDFEKEIVSIIGYTLLGSVIKTIVYMATSIMVLLQIFRLMNGCSAQYSRLTTFEL